MRIRRTRSGISVHAISGLHVVTLGMDATAAARRGLLGFGIHRTDHTENEAYWLVGMKTFRSVVPLPRPGEYFPTRDHPVQSFLWADYTAKPDHEYTYRVVPMYGTPGALHHGRSVSVPIGTESVAHGTHAIYFNRGVAGSQAYARKFGNRTPDQVGGRAPYEWLSRGLEEALLDFIDRAKGPGYALRAAVYEFSYAPVLDRFHDAHRRGVDVEIVYDARKDSPRKDNEKAIAAAHIKRLCHPRREGKSYISHNKFIVLLRNNAPIEVWTGSTNITRGGIFGQANVGHHVKDRAVARQYLRYWQHLRDDTSPGDLRPLNDAESPVPLAAAPKGTTPVFSPRGDLDALEWYADQFGDAHQTTCITFAFQINALFDTILQQNRAYPRYVLLERGNPTYTDRDVLVSVGSVLAPNALYHWAAESLTGFNHWVNYVHTKFMLVDPLSADPLVVSGSANFSNASTEKNDENMLIIRGDTRVADIYLGEFMRLFNHFYARYHANRIARTNRTQQETAAAFLAEDDSWTSRYFRKGTVKEKQRRLFA